MDTQQRFLDYFLEKGQKVLAMMGPSGTGKTLSADFLREYFGYKVARQITTRAPRPDDTYYDYISKEDFVKLQDAGELIGYFDGDRRTYQGNGYGYLISSLGNDLARAQRLIIFPSLYELGQEDFVKYGDINKIAFLFKNSSSVKARALMAGKALSDEALLQREMFAKKSSSLVYDYLSKVQDSKFGTIYSDGYVGSAKETAHQQLLDVAMLSGLTKDKNNKELNSDIDRFLEGRE